MNHSWQKFLVDPKDHNQSALDEISILCWYSANSTFLHGLSGKNLLNLVQHTNLCIHNSERYMFLELILLSCIPTLVYQLIVKSMRAFVCRCLLLLWSVKPFYRRMTRRNKLQYIFHIQDWVKTIVLRRSKCQSGFCSVLPWSITIFYIGIVIGIAHHPMNSWYSDTFAIIVHSSVPVLL